MKCLLIFRRSVIIRGVRIKYSRRYTMDAGHLLPPPKAIQPMQMNAIGRNKASTMMPDKISQTISQTFPQTLDFSG